MPRPALVAALLLATAAAVFAHPHSAPTFWVALSIEDGRVVYELTGLRELLHPRFGIEADAQHPLPEAAQRGAVQGALAYFRAHNAVTIAGARAEPRVVYLGKPKNLEGLEALDYMRLELVFACDGWPGRVDFEWDDLEGAAWQNQKVIPVLLKYGEEIQVTQFSEDERGFSWHAERKPTPRVEKVEAVGERAPVDAGLPLYSFGLAALGLLLLWWLRAVPALRVALALACGLGAGLLADVRVRPPWEPAFPYPSEAQAQEIFAQLHANIYRAFEAGSEDAVYDLLATSVDEGLLEELYLDIHESLILRDQGGAVCRINEVEVLGGHVDLSDDKARHEFETNWRWRVDLSVTHWGHTHGRVNSYEANYLVRHDGVSWKIASIEVVAQERVDDNPDFERDDPLGAIEKIR